MTSQQKTVVNFIKVFANLGNRKNKPVELQCTVFVIKERIYKEKLQKCLKIAINR